MQLKALLLDLDGTLVDTAPDMVGTLNRVLGNHGHAPANSTEAGLRVSNGAQALLEFGFPEQPSDPQMRELIEEFLDDYKRHVADRSRFYPGMLDCLSWCTDHNLPWGVVTNKPLQLSRALLDGLGQLEHCKILLGGDSLPVKKPHPAPLLHSCMVLNVAASECLYVGDHPRDITAGQAAGMDTAVALWGYIDNQQNPSEWGADYLLHQPASLNQLLQQRLSAPLNSKAN